MVITRFAAKILVSGTGVPLYDESWDTLFEPDGHRYDQIKI